MVIKSKQLQEVCRKVLSAADNSSISAVTESLEIILANKQLEMRTTNFEYFVSITMAVESEEELHATVNANKFLSLVSHITTEDVEMYLTDKCLIIKANGEYKLPLVYDGVSMLTVPEITLSNVLATTAISKEALHSITNYNSKTVSKETSAKPTQKLYYIDDQGALTFSECACVNTFNLDSSLRLLITDRLVKLFKLFTEDSVVLKFSSEASSSGKEITKVQFKSDTVNLVSAVPSTTELLAQVPVSAIRGWVTAEYPHEVSLNTEEVLQTIARLGVFTPATMYRPRSKFVFGENDVTIFDPTGQNFEKLSYSSVMLPINNEYSLELDLGDLTSALSSGNESHFNLRFGNKRAVVIRRGHIANVIPEYMQ